HDLSSAWAWNDNGQSTKLTVTCKRTGCTHKKESNATYPSGGITRKQTTAPSCFAMGVNTYTATLTVDSKSYTSSKDVQDIAMIAHTLKGTWAWADNGQSAKLTVTCTATGCTHKKESTATYPNGGITRKQKSAPTCSKMGVNTYTATLTVDGNKYTQTKDVQDIPLSGHNFAGGECATCHEHEYLTFTATGSVTLGIENKNGNAPSVEYTLDDGATWTTWDYTAINLTDGQKVRLRGSNPTGFSNPGNDETTSIYDIPYSIFTTSGSGTLAASGYLMSLIDVHSATTAIPSRACFYRLFNGCKNLTTPPALSATTLTADCYSDMFYSCSKLTSAPALPATTLAESCYNNMFRYCRALSEATALPATTLAVNCYNAMFSDCSNLTQAPALPATTLTNSCYDYMFGGCTSLTQAPELPATTLAYNCYNGMFMNCTSLSEAPALPATALTQYCYASMFSGCSNLSQAPAMPATTLAEYCYHQMFRDCSNLTQAPALPATTLVDGCYNSMFMNCTSLSEAPALPATTLATNCYFDMFNGCTSLTQAPALPATTLTESCYREMFMNCTSLAQAPALPATTLVYGCYKQMFYNCASLNRIEVAFTDWGDSYTPDWLANVASEGEFICPTALETIVGSSFIPEGWTVKHNDEPQFATGDVNGDGTIDIADINSIISIILESATNASFGNRGDVNGNGEVDIADINACISIILEK
ncbi:MAG: leucine-rich repeat protein, partial [Bacteroidales bacterium]|nr:leucine-rich repeat protein [Candidatus Sodaliphilus fimicaballi]